MSESNSSVDVSRIEACIERIESLSDRLRLLMESQSRAVIESDTDRLEQLTEDQTGLIAGFTKEKRELKSEIESLISLKDSTEGEVVWSRLQEVFPEKADRLGEYKERLQRTTGDLQRKQKQVNDLLHFAKDHNERLLRQMFQQPDSEKGAYLRGGEPQTPKTGMTINREV